MPHQISINRNLGWIISLVFLATPAAAHTVKTSGDVAATFHLEPNHTPKAGEPSQVWFALTQEGGQVIPLKQCNCQLAIYPKPQAKDASPLLEPPLKPVSDEEHRGIPGADIIFPKVGDYELELRGTPTLGASFKPFELSFEVTVAPGTQIPVASPQAAQQPTQSMGQGNTPIVVLAVVLSLGILWLVVRRLKLK